MLPEIWIFDTYSICMVVGVIMGFLLFYHMGLKAGFKKVYIYDVLILAVFTIVFGILTSALAQWLFNAIGGNNKLEGMTFYGGLLGGAAFFIGGYFLVIKRIHKEAKFMDILIIAPSIITLCHAFGRIGCFCAGCCYGVETDSFLGVTFPGMAHKVLPTQLFESCFLFVLTLVLYLLTVKKKFKYTMPLYMISYGIWRFFIEFFRGDDRGGFILGLSPAQFISTFLVVGGIALIIIYKLIKEPTIEKETE